MFESETEPMAGMEHESKMTVSCRRKTNDTYAVQAEEQHEHRYAMCDDCACLTRELMQQNTHYSLVNSKTFGSHTVEVRSTKSIASNTAIPTRPDTQLKASKPSATAVMLPFSQLMKTKATDFVRFSYSQSTEILNHGSRDFQMMMSSAA